MATMAVDGECARRFAAVRAAFAANFDAGREIGASFAATVDGEPVVDLWGGFADAAARASGSATRSSTSSRRPRR